MHNFFEGWANFSLSSRVMLFILIIFFYFFWILTRIRVLCYELFWALESAWVEGREEPVHLPQQRAGRWANRGAVPTFSFKQHAEVLIWERLLFRTEINFYIMRNVDTISFIQCEAIRSERFENGPFS